MGKYIKTFSAHTDYEAYTADTANFIKPNVSFCKDVQNVVHYSPYDFSDRYLTFKAREQGTFTLTIGSAVTTSLLESISYSTDSGETWTTTNNVNSQTVTITTPTINEGDKVLWKGSGTSMSIATNNTAAADRPASSSIFSSSGEFDIEGNIMSLLYGDDFEDKKSFAEGSSSNFALLFYSNNVGPAKVIDANKMCLPATVVKDFSYLRMFQSCTTLVRGQKVLPAMTLASGCYNAMFYGCTSLTTAPSLPATTLADGCYYGMFYGCTSLTIAPVLSATTLANYCYSWMLYGCTSLTTAPELPATALTQECYSHMFQNCASLTTAPELPATTLIDWCYEYMFYGCTSLTTAPVLSATTLKQCCYQRMFYGCTKLNSITCLATNISANQCTTYWLSGVASSGTFTKAVSMTSWQRGTSGIPTNWTVVDAT